MKSSPLWLLAAAALLLSACAAAPAASSDPVSSAAVEATPDPTEPPGATPAPTPQPSPVPEEILYQRYIADFPQESGTVETAVTANGCTLMLEDSPDTAPELMVYSSFVYRVTGDLDGLDTLLGEDLSFVGAMETEAAEFGRGEAGQETKTLHELHTMTLEEVQGASDYTRTALQQYLADYDLRQWTMVAVDESWTCTPEQEANAQLPAGRYQRYYLLGIPSGGGDSWKLYNVYWEDFYPTN